MNDYLDHYRPTAHTSRSAAFGERVLSFLSPWEDERLSAPVLFERAQVCSRLAKCSFFSRSKTLYQYKNEYLKIIMRDYASLSLLNIDRGRYPGLLSLRLRNSSDRLHTHENWLKAA